MMATNVQIKMLEHYKQEIETLKHENAGLRNTIEAAFGKNLTLGKINNIKHEREQYRQNYQLIKDFLMQKQVFSEFKEWKRKQGKL